MKRILTAVLALVLLTSPALAVPNDDSTGPEGPNAATPTSEPRFDLDFKIATTTPYATATNREVSTDRYVLADGWDFGDRAAYRCAWVEWFQGQNEKFEVAFHGVTGYPGHSEVVDRFGAELPDADIVDECWDLDPPPGEATPNFGPPFSTDGSDHFPHMIHSGDGIYFYSNGDPLLDAQGDQVFLDLAQPACSKIYWTPGDVTPGQAWLWWDEDGPTFSHGPGEGDLGCGGGPIEPVALFRAKVRDTDADIGWCVHSEHEEQCVNVEQPPTPVQLGSGKSVLTCPNSSTPAVVTTEPLVVSCP
jgi:hypothetical protein